ncbi:MAG: single-stranded DNA-binding protein [Bacteroidales bacterium]|nr:single-stranded DNA-binding protein [Bacteroidales bacterium]
MEHINRIELQGRVGTIRTNIVNGSKVANFSLATDHLYKGRDGNGVSETTWHTIVAWENKDMPDLDTIAKGTPLYVSGRMRATKYKNSDGVDKQIMEVLANRIRIVSEDLASNC